MAAQTISAASKIVAGQKRLATRIDAHIGSRIKLRRLSLGLTQKQIAESLGVTFQQIQKYEIGTNRICASRLFVLAQMLGVSLEYFMDGLATPKQKPSSYSYVETDVVELMATREGTALAKAFTRISDAHLRRTVVELVTAMSKRKAGAE